MSGRKLVSCIVLMVAGLCTSAGAIVIDNFTTGQGPLSRTAPGDFGTPISGTAVGGGILGGERDIEVTLLSTTPAGNRISVVVASFNHSQDGGITGTSLTTWDGVDGNGSSSGIAHTGLGGIDLTVGGTHTALLLDIISADLMSTIVFEVFTDAGNSSVYSLNLAGGAFNDIHVIPYASFTTNLGAGADFTNVGAITMLIDGSAVPALDVVMAKIETTPQITVTKTDAHFVDVDGDGNVDVGDTIQYTITITNPDDDGNLPAPGVIFTDTPDPSTTLVVGSVSTSQGVVTLGNTGGDTSVAVNVGNIADGASVTIMFSVTVTAEKPEVCNQGFAGTVPSDDPDTQDPLDPTCTEVTFCGDGFINDVTELCDGAAEAPGVDCTQLCRDSGGMDPCTCCGDGVLQSTSGETCDGTVFGGGAPSSHGPCRDDCTYCGDGIVQMGEECDDGNDNDNDSCSNNCTMGCGNNIVNTGESCDGPAEAPGVDCTQPCRDSAGMDPCTCCGDGILQPNSESCDGSVFEPGAPSSHGPCRNDCTYCGDGEVNGGEQCDDGNNVNNDGCTNACTLPRCGDGIVQMGEECDDGNLINNDDCSNNCTMGCGNEIINTGELCDGPAEAPGVDCTQPCRDSAGMDPCTCCGDGILQPNSESCDGSVFEPGAPSSHGPCRNDCTYCGDGEVNGGEQCDDGNAVNNDGCTNACTLPRCGDGILQAGEECDDGNNVNGDGCQANCMNPRCGDGIVDPGEACDDGNLINNDGCTNNCALPTCGDGIVQPPEECDDGNQNNNDSCTNNCTVARCGDGIVQGAEQCDDGNVINNDGCTNFCTLPRCGDGILQAGEECDGAAGTCQAGTVCRQDCTCGPEPGDDIPTVSEWGLIVLALLLGTMAKLQFGLVRRRAA